MEHIEEMVFSFFQLHKLKPVAIRKGVWQVMLSDELAKELDGWRAKGGLFQFTFDKKLSENYGAELISYGSHRLDSFLRVIRKRGILSLAHLPADIFYEPTVRQKLMDRLRQFNQTKRWYILNHKRNYGPYVWFILRLTFLAYEKKEEIKKPLVDLATGKVVNIEIPDHLLRSGDVPHELRLKRKLSYKKAYENLRAHLTTELDISDHSWAEEANQALEAERLRIEEFFQGSEDNKQKELRLKELYDRSGPRIQVRPIRAALLYLPKFEYRVMEVGLTEVVRNASYDPVSNQFQLC